MAAHFDGAGRHIDGALGMASRDFRRRTRFEVEVRVEQR